MITIIQVCDGCGKERELLQPSQADNGGWRLVTGKKHLCVDCIKGALRDEE